MSWRDAYRAVTAQAQAQQAVAGKRQRYTWSRLDNDFPDRPIWRAVALQLNVPVHQVVAVALRLVTLANRSTPRGSIADMSVPEFAAALDLRPETVARIRSAFEDPAISWIDQDFVADFFLCNPDHSDPTATERKRRQRARLKAAREDDVHARAPPLSTGVTRDTVTVTPRSDQIIKKSPPVENSAASPARRVGEEPQEAVRAEHGESAEKLTGVKASPDLWLKTEGVRIVTERLMCHPTLAATRIARWRDQDLAGDAAALAEIILAADRADYMSGRFHNLIVDHIRRRQVLQHGPQLPLMPPRPEAKANRRLK